MTAAGCNEYPLKAACRWCLFQARAASAERARELVGTTGQSGRLSQDAARRAPMCVEAHLIPCGAAHGRRRRYRQAQRVGVRDGSPKGRDAGSMRSTTARSATPRRTEASAAFRVRENLAFADGFVSATPASASSFTMRGSTRKFCRCCGAELGETLERNQPIDGAFVHHTRSETPENRS